MEIDNKKIETTDEKKLIKKIVLIGFLVEFIYFIVSCSIGTKGFYFRDWVGDSFFAGFVILILVGAVLVFLDVYNGENSGFEKFIAGIIELFVIGLILLVVFVGFALTNTTSNTVYKNGEEFIAEVNIGFLDSTVDYYKPVNFFLMKDSDIKSIMYRGAYNIYETENNLIEN